MAFTFILLLFLSGLFLIPGYVLTSIGLYAIAERRGIQRPWQVWFPVLNLYVLGCISDQYQAMVRGKNRNRRIAILLLIMVLLVAFCAMHLAAPTDTAADSMLPFLLIFVAAWAAAAALVVVSFVALYDVYVSCDPKHAELFLVLSIVFPVTQPVFLLLCRNKDLGFPL